MDACKDGIMAVIIPPHNERIGAGIQHMKVDLPLPTQYTHRCCDALPQVQVGIVC